jgi:hypothetical protein
MSTPTRSPPNPQALPNQVLRQLLSLRPGHAGERMLRSDANRGEPLHVRIWISYTPTGGATRTVSVTARVLAAHQ